VTPMRTRVPTRRLAGPQPPPIDVAGPGKPSRRPRRNVLTRGTLAVAIAVVGLLTVLAGPAAADPGSRSTMAAPAPARILVGPGTGSCPAGYACFWEAANFQGRGVGFYNSEPKWNTMSAPYGFINDIASSAFNNGTSGMQISMCQHPNYGGHCISLARGWTFPDLSHPALNMNDTISSMRWFWA
jgi:hypothetical protein